MAQWESGRLEVAGTRLTEGTAGRQENVLTRLKNC